MQDMNKFYINGEKIEVRWHTKTSGAPENQSNTFVVQKNIPGNSQGKEQIIEIMIGDDKWVNIEVWNKAITDRKNGVSTPEQDKILSDGHWKE